MKPILFNTEMVRAILDGRKTATRRVVKPQPPKTARLEYAPKYGEALDYETCPYPSPNERVAYKAPYLPGNILYVRETWAEWEGGYVFKADPVPSYPHSFVDHWRPSIHMPAEAARIFLRVTDVRVERLQEIDGAGAEAEGAIEINNPMIREDKVTFDAYGRKMFAVLWEATVGEAKRVKNGWAANPWVWVIEFERCGRPKEG